MTDPDEDAPELYCRHLIACRVLWHDPADGDSGYSLGRLLVHIRPADAHGYGFTAPRLFLFAQLHGAPGEYTVRARMVSVESDEGGNETEGPPVEFGPWDILLTGEDFVDSFGIPLVRVPFALPGVYEFQLWADGFDEPLARERVQARE